MQPVSMQTKPEVHKLARAQEYMLPAISLGAILSQVELPTVPKLIYTFLKNYHVICGSIYRQSILPALTQSICNRVLHVSYAPQRLLVC